MKYLGCLTRLITVLLGTVEPDTSGNLIFKAEVNDYEHACPDITNFATIDSDQTEESDSHPIIVLPVDPFVFEKEVRYLGEGRLFSGDILIWTIKMRNIGHIPTTNILVVDEVPENTTYVTGSITGRGADDTNPAILRWEVGSLDVGEEVSLTFQTRVNKGVPAGTVIRN